MENYQELTNKQIQFSEIETKILQMIAQGKSVEEMAAILNINESKVETMRITMIQKVKAKNNYGMVAYGFYTGILQPQDIDFPIIH